MTIYKALADFQQECPVIHKDRDGYGYTYADLPQILETVNPLLKKHGLGFTQCVNASSIKTILFHIESGQTIESETNIPQGVELKGMNAFQVLGSAISYIRRYALSSMLGIVTDKDTDAAAAKAQATTKFQTSTPTKQLIQLEEGDANYIKVIKALKDGYTIKDIEGKYEITPELRVKLINESSK